MSKHSWRNLNERKEQIRQLERHYRKVGYSDGYALLVAKSLDAHYQSGWREGRTARQAFDRDALLNNLDD